MKSIVYNKQLTSNSRVYYVTFLASLMYSVSAQQQHLVVFELPTTCARPKYYHGIRYINNRVVTVSASWKRVICFATSQRKTQSRIYAHSYATGVFLAAHNTPVVTVTRSRSSGNCHSDNVCAVTRAGNYVLCSPTRLKTQIQQSAK